MFRPQAFVRIVALFSMEEPHGLPEFQRSLSLFCFPCLSVSLRNTVGNTSFNEAIILHYFQSLGYLLSFFSPKTSRLLLANCMDRALQNDIHAMNIDQVQANAAVSVSCEFLQKISALVSVQQAPVRCSFV